MTDVQNRNIALWLLSVSAVIFGMICLGGVTRLTGSGLSMVQWAPITGILPPLTEQAWQAVFKLYQASPEFMKVNMSIDLDGFKSIFWFEYFHRLLGRTIGLIFFLPMVYFFIRYPLSTKRKLQLFGLFLLGGAQGLMGWYMVKSGLVNDPHVSQYRLVAHLALALVLYCVLVWLGTGHFLRHWQQRYITPRSLSLASNVLFALVFITLLAGGFVAGTKAGFAFNTFPLMNGHVVPEGYLALSPWWLNAFENIAAVQFNHRLLATLTLLLTLVVSIWAMKVMVMPALKRLYFILFGAVLLQYGLGIITLLKVVPVSLGAIHQGWAVVVLTCSLLIIRALSQFKHQS
ncbi:MAG: COX15/CtaA family protein [Arenicellales bacterium]